MIFSESWGYSERWFLRIGRDNQQKPPKSAEIMVTIRGNTATWCYLLEWWILGFPGSHNATNFYFPIEWQFQLNLISLSFGLRVWQLPKVPCIEIMRRHSWRHKFGFVSSGYANAAILRYSMLPQVKMGHMMISHGVWGPQLWDRPRWT